MPPFKVKIVNCSTGEETIRDATPEEILEAEQYDNERIIKAAEAEAKAAAKAALLDRLGITAEEAALLLA